MNKIKNTKSFIIILSLILIIALIPLTKDLSVRGRLENSSEIEFDPNITTMVIELKGGKLEQIDADITHETKATAIYQMYDGDGVVFDEGSFTINGHGNSTWSEIMYEFPGEEFKRSYNLDFGKEKSLLNMGAVKDYCLLSGYYDETLIRNKVGSEVAKGIGCEYIPECEFVNVYINGDYKGLYLLSQRIKSYMGIMDIEEDGFLARYDYEERLCDKPHYFLSGLGYSEILGGGFEKESYYSDAAWNLREAENSIIESAREGTTAYRDYIDEDSFARYYLIQEFFENLDADNASIYYYKENGDSLIKAGPIWDFDLSMGHSWSFGGDVEEYCLWIPGYINQSRGWLRRLSKCPAFMDRVYEIYYESFSTEIDKAVNELIPSLHKRLENSWNKDRARWKDSPNYYEKLDDKLYGLYSPSYNVILNQITSFLTNRQSFFNDYCQNTEDYYYVTFHTAYFTNDSRNFIMPVKKNEELRILPSYPEAIGWVIFDGTHMSGYSIAYQDLDIFPEFENED